jgi:hypothetical protein
LRIALGLAVPTIEAWYLVGTDARVGEYAWTQALDKGRLPYAPRDLKHKVYGTDRPALALETERAEESARRLVQNFDGWEKLFPAGFGPFAQEVRSW